MNVNSVSVCMYRVRKTIWRPFAQNWSC